MTDDISQQAQDLVKCLHRESVVIADNLGLLLDAEELRWVKERVVALWVQERLTDPQYPWKVGQARTVIHDGAQIFAEWDHD